MYVTFYRITIPYSLHYNSIECPINYQAKKFNFDYYLPLPKSSRIIDNQFYICLPAKMSMDFLDLMEQEGCVYESIRTEETRLDSFENTHIREVREIYNGMVMKTAVVLTKDI